MFGTGGSFCERPFDPSWRLHATAGALIPALSTTLPTVRSSLGPSRFHSLEQLLAVPLATASAFLIHSFVGIKMKCRDCGHQGHRI
jgi:hypothetical protein